MTHHIKKFPRIDPKSSFYFSDGRGIHIDSPKLQFIQVEISIFVMIAVDKWLLLGNFLQEYKKVLILSEFNMKSSAILASQDKALESKTFELE